MQGAGHSRNLMGERGQGRHGGGLGACLAQVRAATRLLMNGPQAGWGARTSRGEAAGLASRGFAGSGQGPPQALGVSPGPACQALMERRPPHSHLGQTDLGQFPSPTSGDTRVPWSGWAGEATLTFGPFLPPEENPSSPLLGGASQQ